MMPGDALLRAIAVIFWAIVAVFGWLWNILIVVVMMHNRLPVDRRHQIAGIMPYGLSLFFTGVGIWLAVAWYRDFRDGRYPEDTDWLTRLGELP